MSNQAVAVDQKFIALGLASENRMIVDHQASFALPSLSMEDQRCREATDAASDNRAVVEFSGLNKICGKAFKFTVADAMTSFEHGRSVAVGICVVADAAVAGPVIANRLGRLILLLVQ